MENIFNEIRQERQRQDAKWGEQNHKPVEWCAILGEEVGEVNKAALEAHFREYYRGTNQLANYREELIQVAAVAIAMIESLERNKPLYEKLHEKTERNQIEVDNTETKKYQLGVMRNVERFISRDTRKTYPNWRLVDEFLLRHTEKGGRTSSYIHCQWLGVDPDGFTFWDNKG